MTSPEEPRELPDAASPTMATTTRRDCLRLVATLSGGLAVGSTVVAAGVLPGTATAVPIR